MTDRGDGQESGEPPAQAAVKRLIGDIQVMVRRIGVCFEPDARKVEMFTAAMAAMTEQARTDLGRGVPGSNGPG